MTELRLKIRRMEWNVGVTLCVIAVPVVLGFLYALARFIWWGLDRNYHLFSWLVT